MTRRQFGRAVSRGNRNTPQLRKCWGRWGRSCVSACGTAGDPDTRSAYRHVRMVGGAILTGTTGTTDTGSSRSQPN